MVSTLNSGHPGDSIKPPGLNASVIYWDGHASLRKAHRTIGGWSKAELPRWGLRLALVVPPWMLRAGQGAKRHLASRHQVGLPPLFFAKRCASLSRVDVFVLRPFAEEA